MHDVAYHLGVNVSAVLVETGQRERDGPSTLSGCSLDAIVGGGEDEENAGEESGERESELHDEYWNRPAL